MPTKQFILKSSELNVQYETHHTIQEKHFASMNKINNKRKVMDAGKHMLLKDQTVITTEGIYEQLKACEKATKKRRCAKERTKRTSGLQVALNSAKDVQSKEEVQDIIMLDEIIVI